MSLNLAPNPIAPRKDVRESHPSHAIQRWLVNRGPTWLILVIWISANIAIMTNTFIVTAGAGGAKESKFKLIYGLLGYPLAVARSAASGINLNIALLLLSVCRNLISILRATFLNSFIPFDDSIQFHQLLGHAIAILTIVHALAHYQNILEISKLSYSPSPNILAFLTGPGLTGHLAIFTFFLIYSTSLKNVRLAKFELFWYTHHLFIVYLGLNAIHGTFCFLFASDGSCISPNFWKAMVGPFALYLIERVIREIRSRRPTFISKIVVHPSKVLEVQLKKQGFTSKPGQYVFLNCPTISKFQWHPFTLTNAVEDGYLSVHIRIVGDWTETLSRKLGCCWDKADYLDTIPISSLPPILVDGPFGTSSEDLFSYQVAMCFGAGIGLTPFASLLKSIWYHFIEGKRMTLKKVYFFGICRNLESFEWFIDILRALEEENSNGFIEVYLFLTGTLPTNQIQNLHMRQEGEKDIITGLKSPIYFERPNFDNIFLEVLGKHKKSKIGCFFCGPMAISDILDSCCNKYTSGVKGETKFFYNKENF